MFSCILQPYSRLDAHTYIAYIWVYPPPPPQGFLPTSYLNCAQWSEDLQEETPTHLSSFHPQVGDLNWMDFLLLIQRKKIKEVWMNDVENTNNYGRHYLN